MPIQLTREIEGTGHTANYWKLEEIHLSLTKVASEKVIVGTFRLYKSASDYPTKRRTRISEIVRIVGNIIPETKIGEIHTLLETNAIAVDGPLEGGTII